MNKRFKKLSIKGTEVIEDMINELKKWKAKLPQGA